jgi:hypothetical protein
MNKPRGTSADGPAIWLFAAGYFGCYVPYAALTKLVSDGRLLDTGGRIDGFGMLPLSTLASLVAMLVFITAKRWWRHASTVHLMGATLPSPTRWTFLSGLATAAIIATTTLAYTFEGVSIVFVMLLMRGGVLVIAPVVDALAKRKVNTPSWLALALSIAALVVTVRPGVDGRMTALAMFDVAVYLGGYFLRLRFMSRLAKGTDEAASIRYFVEEQMVATPAIVAALAGYALVGRGSVADSLRWGFSGVWSSDAWLPILVIGLLSQGTGVFGALVLLDRRTNVFCVAVNRASSVLAGTVATATLGLVGFGAEITGRELTGAGLLVTALVALAWPTVAPLLHAGGSPPTR